MDFEDISTNEKINYSIESSFYNVLEGTYNAYFDGSDTCCLFSSSNPEILKYKLNEYCSNLILRKIKDLEYERIEIINRYYRDYNISVICEINNKFKEIFVQTKYKKELVNSGEIIFNLKSNKEYVISDFIRTNYGGIITSNECRYFVSEKVIDILEKYFKQENNEIICEYDNNKCTAKVSLVTKNDITTKENIKCINQNLKVVINNKRFTFYVNHSEYLDYKKKGVYYFLVMYIHNDSIYGYEINEDKYYSLKFERKLILNNIDQRITRALEDMEKQDLYTYLLYNNEIRGLIIKIDKAGNDQFRKTPNFARLDKPFESILDISLLRPKVEWDDTVELESEQDIFNDF